MMGNPVSRASALARPMAEPPPSAMAQSARTWRTSTSASATTAQPLEEMAAKTSGAYHQAATTAALDSVYSSIRAELRRTWRVEYVTGAAPGDKLHLRVSINPDGAASSDVTVPASFAPVAPHGGGLPSPFYSPLAGLVVTLIVAFLVLCAGGLLFAGGNNSWVKGRLAPHVEGGTRRKRRRENPCVSPSGKPLALLQSGHSILLFGSFGLRIARLSVEKKLQRIQEHPLQVFAALPKIPPGQVRD